MIKTTSMIFNSEMVRALLAGNKTQTRRPVNAKTTELIRCHAGDDGDDEAEVSFAYGNAKDDSGKIHDKQWLVYSSEYPEEGAISLGQCPFGKDGDLIAVRETFGFSDPDYYDYETPMDVIYRTELNRPVTRMPEKWKPSIHMPRWASRLTLKINSVRVERIQDTSEDDAKKEGIKSYPFTPCDGFPVCSGFTHLQDDDGTSSLHPSAVKAFENLWSSVYPESWNKNEWVWVVDFEVIHKNIDLVLAEMEQTS